MEAHGRRILRVAGLVARQQEDRVRRQRAGALLDRRGDGRREEDRRGLLLRPVQDAAARLVARLALDRLRAQQRGAHPDRVYVYSLEQDKSLPGDRRPVRREPSRSSTAAASTSSSSPRPTRARSTTGSRSSPWTCATRSAIYMAVLRKDLPSPLVKESDEEKAAAEAADKKGGAEADKKEKKDEGPDKTDAKSDEKPKAPPRRRAGPDRLRRDRATGSSTFPFRRPSCRTCRRARRGRSSSCARRTERTRSSAST